MIAAIFQTAGLNAPSCGNIGYAACELALEKNSNNYDWIIAELSSYQIEASSQLTPQIGVWTTFTPDHLARHKTLENYYQIKASLLQRSPQQIINGDDPYLHSLGLTHWENACWTSVKGKDNLICQPAKGIFIEDGWVVAFEETILPISSLQMVGEHNLQNLLMAVAAARLAGIDKQAIAEAITNFGGVPHRLEYICSYGGANFINDSKATNYDAAQVGLAAVDSPTILIAGGEAKAGDDTAWIETIKEKASHVLLIGEAAPQFSQRLQDCGYHSCEVITTMENAVARAAEIAQQNQDIPVVLLSPACTSFDQYQSFEHRGEHFRQLCQNLCNL
jgi:UDP-N-acetylmuramoylalanine--D-glutamate ligase